MTRAFLLGESVKQLMVGEAQFSTTSGSDRLEGRRVLKLNVKKMKAKIGAATIASLRITEQS